ncbi:MAG: phosphomannomutase, partial [Halobacteria archaeon]|nr:phosphomannomutase [Halobacteria archaeon]
GRMADEDSDVEGVVVGRDGRHTGGSLVSAFVSGVESSGADTVKVGKVPTHVLAWYARGSSRYRAMVTASHNPPEDNGVKLFSDSGTEMTEEVEERIEKVIEDGTNEDWERWSSDEKREVVDGYVEDAVEYVGSRTDGKPKLDIRVAVDCGNGVGALTTPQVLGRLGCDVVTFNAQIDGSFPGRSPKPEEGSLTEFAEFVSNGGFDLGVAHDGDADRTVVLDPEGSVVPEDAVLAALARDRVEGRGTNEETPVVVTTPNTSSKVDETVENAGGKVRRTPLGSLSEALEEFDDVVFAAEPWKHLFPDFGGWVDGTVTAAEVVRLVDEKGGVETLFQGLDDVSIDKVNVDCPEGRKEEVMERVIERLSERFEGEIDSTNGVRVDFKDDGSWVLVRPSGTEPLIRVYSESKGRDDVLTEVVGVVEEEVDEPS